MSSWFTRAPQYTHHVLPRDTNCLFVDMCFIRRVLTNIDQSWWFRPNVYKDLPLGKTFYIPKGGIVRILISMVDATGWMDSTGRAMQNLSFLDNRITGREPKNLLTERLLT